MGSDAPPLLLKAAKRLEPLNLELARETYLSAWMAAMLAGRLAGAGDLLEVSRAARALPAPADPPRPADLILDGLALLVTDGPAAAAPTLRHVVNAFAGPGISEGEGLRWGWFAQAAASALWDEDAWHAMLVRQVRLAHDAGALDQLPIMLGALGTATVWSGDFAAAALLIAQADAVCEATGSRAAPFAAMMLASLRGDQAEADPLIEATIAQATAGGQGNAVAYAHWVAAILANGLGRYEGALAAARHASEDTFTLHVSMWALPELVEAAARTGNTEVAAGALERLAETYPGRRDRLRAGPRGTLPGAMLERRGGRRRSVPRGDRPAGPHPAASGAGPRAPAVRGVAARARAGRADARGQLRTAHDMFAAMGMEAFAGRARRELIATGEKVPKRSAETRDRLTPQEEQIARLAREGRTSPEIGAQLFLSARTVEWHLGKVFTKLGIGSRRELRAALAGPRLQDQPAVAKVSATGARPGWFLRPPLGREQRRRPQPKKIPRHGQLAGASGLAGPVVLGGSLRVFRPERGVVMAGTRYPMDNVSRVLEGGTQARSVEKKFNWPGRARVLRPAPGTPTPSRTASGTATASASPMA